MNFHRLDSLTFGVRRSIYFQYFGHVSQKQLFRIIECLAFLIPPIGPGLSKIHRSFGIIWTLGNQMLDETYPMLNHKSRAPDGSHAINVTLLHDRRGTNRQESTINHCR